MEKELPQGGRMMDKKRRLIKLYEAEIQKIRDIRTDIELLNQMSEEHLIAFLQKAQYYDRVLRSTWEQICRNDIEIDIVQPIFLCRKQLREDFPYIHSVEEEIKDLKQQMREKKKELKSCHDAYRHRQKIARNKLILFFSFAIMFVCAIVFQAVMFSLYHDLWVPSMVIMLVLPLALSFFYGILFLRSIDDESEEIIEELEDDLQLYREQLKQKQEEIDFFETKYRNVFAELDDYQLQAYPYVEKILGKIEYRQEYMKAKHEYQGMMELEHFRRPEIYLYIPRIFLIEEVQNRFMQQMQEKMRKMDEYLVQTIETN